MSCPSARYSAAFQLMPIPSSQDQDAGDEVDAPRHAGKVGERHHRVVERPDVLAVRSLWICAGRLREDMAAGRGEVEALALERLDVVLDRVEVRERRDWDWAAIVHCDSPVRWVPGARSVALPVCLLD